MITFRYLDKKSADKFLPVLFKILHSNMSVIAPTGNSYEVDFNFWCGAVLTELEKDARQIILIYDDSEIIGYFQYYINAYTFMMEDIQLCKEYQGKGIFQKLYAYLYEVVPHGIRYVEAYASKKNFKSQGVLRHLGLEVIGENKNGLSYHFRGYDGLGLKKYDARTRSIQTVVQKISEILSDCDPSVYLYGSVVLEDFKLGWSDIDILVLTDKQMSEAQANELVSLRQTLLEKEPDNLYYRSFEGGMLTLEAFLSGSNDRVVYWGTGGEKITHQYALDSFSRKELIIGGELLCGRDVRNKLKMPDHAELYFDVGQQYETIRKYAQKTNRSLYSFGWMLNIARCIYTLLTGELIAKTAAAEWALEDGGCPDPDVLEMALKVRRRPLIYKESKEILDCSETLGEPVQRYADVLGAELEKPNPLRRGSKAAM